VVPLATLREVIDRIAHLLKLDGEELVRRLLQLALVWVLAWAARQLVKVIARRIIASVDDGDDSTFTEAEQRGHTLAQLVRSLGMVLVTVMALLATLNVFIDITPLLAGAGILGLAFSFGAQSIVKDTIAGFFILLENQFVVGDFIEVAGKSGTVERMTLRAVTLRDGDGTMHVVPNGQITTVSNRTRKWSRAVVDVSVSYAADTDRVVEVLKQELEAFAADPAWKDRVEEPPEVQGVESLGESAVVLRTRVKVQAGTQWEVARELRRRFKKRLDAEGIEIPVPQLGIEHRVRPGQGDLLTGRGRGQ
jgi:moderate conductance mechanosensitive channel